MTYEQIIQKTGKRITPRVFYYEDGNEISINRDEFQQAKFLYNASLVGTIMFGVELEVKTLLPDTEIFIEITARYNEYTQKKVYGGYFRRNEPKYNADSKTYSYEMYDKFITAMVSYKPLQIEYPTTVFNFFKQLVNELNFTTDITSLPNGEQVIEKDIYEKINYTYRDVLNDIGQATGTLFIIDGTVIKKCTFGVSEIVVNDDILKNQNITLGEHYGPINTIVLSRSGNSDNIYYPEVLPEKPIEFIISDNQLMNENNRDLYLKEIYNQLKGIEFDIYDTKLVGYGGFEPLSKIKIVTGGKEYNSYVFNNEVTITQGYEEVIYTEKPKEMKVDYSASDTTDRRLNQVFIIARKNEKEIQAVVDTTEKIEKNLNPTKDVTGEKIILEDALNKPLLELKINGKSEQETRTGKNTVSFVDSERESAGLITIVKNNKFKISGTPTSASGSLIYDIVWVLTGGEYTFSVSKPLPFDIEIWFNSVKYAVIKKGETFKTFNLDRNPTSLGLTFADATVGEAIKVDDLIVQLEKGSVATSPEIFGLMPSTDFESEIKNVGYENLLTGEFRKGNFAGSVNDIRLFSDENYYIEKGRTYTFGTNAGLLGLEYGINIASVKFPIPSIDYIIFDTGWQNKEYITFTAEVSGYLGIPISKVNKTETVSLDDLNDVWFTLTETSKYISEGHRVIVISAKNGTDISTLPIVLEQPLRELPNGIKDIAYIKNNRLYVDRYVGSEIFDGREEWYFEGSADAPAERSVIRKYFESKGENVWLSNRFKMASDEFPFNGDIFSIGQNILYLSIRNRKTDISSSDDNSTKLNKMKGWLAGHHTELQYELAEPYTEQIGEINMPALFKGYNEITTTDELNPTLELKYIRDTVIGEYVENHVAEIKITEGQIKESVSTVSESVDGLSKTIDRVEETTTSNSKAIEIVSTNIDMTTGEVREITTTNGFKFNADGLSIYTDENSYNTLIDNIGTYYKDGNEIVGQTTKDGSLLKNLKLQGQTQYSFDGDSYDFIEERVEVDGEYCYATFYSGEE